MKKNSFSKEERLKKSEAIRNVFDNIIPFKGRLVNIYILKSANRPPINRVAFIIRKALCNKKAALRNRLKRLLREAYRKTKHLLPQGHDIVILATNVKKNTNTGVLEKEMANAFKKAIEK